MNRRAFTRTLAGAALGAAFHETALSAGTGAPEGEAPGVSFKLSVMLWTVFRKMPFEERLEKVAEAGYHAVELVGEFNREKWTEEDLRKYNRKKRALGMTFDTTAGLRHGVGDPSVRDAFLSDLRDVLKIMEKLECPQLIVMSGNKVEGLTHEAQHQSCVEGLKRAAEVVEGRKVKLLLENIDPEENPKYFLTSVAEGFKIIEEVNHPQVKFLYDFFHEQISEGNLIKKLEQNIDKVGLVHIADVPGRHEPGTGEINYENIFKKLGQLKYDRYAAMEFIPTGDQVQSLRAAREMAIRAGRA